MLRGHTRKHFPQSIQLSNAFPNPSYCPRRKSVCVRLMLKSVKEPAEHAAVHAPQPMQGRNDAPLLSIAAFLLRSQVSRSIERGFDIENPKFVIQASLSFQHISINFQADIADSKVHRVTNSNLHIPLTSKQALAGNYATAVISAPFF